MWASCNDDYTTQTFSKILIRIWAWEAIIVIESDIQKSVNRIYLDSHCIATYQYMLEDVFDTQPVFHIPCEGSDLAQILWSKIE